MNLDQELHAALEVEPSPEFVARVRLRIANEPAPRTWRNWWWMPVAVAIPMLVVVAISMQTIAVDREATSRLLTARNLPSIVAPTASPASAIGDATRPPNHGTAKSGNAPKVSEAAGEPLVMIDAAEAATMQRLVFGPPLALDKPYVGTTLAAIEIAPLSIDPLPIGSEGVRQ